MSYHFANFVEVQESEEEKSIMVNLPTSLRPVKLPKLRHMIKTNEELIEQYNQYFELPRKNGVQIVP